MQKNNRYALAKGARVEQNSNYKHDETAGEKIAPGDGFLGLLFLL
jgi:hypothetical protein